MKHVVIGTAGHIDHGKSALVLALTGTDPDRLKEEKQRGITIDLGFAFLSDETGEEPISLGFVDVPGHERFVKNMLAGVGGIDLVMLVVAADESVMPQTREHFEICSLLRIPRGVVVITKADLVDAELRELAAMEVKEMVAGSFLEGAPVLNVSARTGEGIDELKRTLFDVARGIEGRPAGGLFRLPVDRVFSMRGFGTVVTGTLIAGSVGLDEEVEVLPRGLRTRVRGLQVHGRKVERASAGQRTAVNLQGVEVAELERGDTLVRSGTFSSTMMLDADLSVLASSPIPIKDLSRLHLHLGTAQVVSRVRVLGGAGAIPPGGQGLVQLRLEAPVVAARGDRFIVRRYSPLQTLGGGVVLDPLPAKHSVARREVVDELRELREGDAVAAAARFVREAGERGISGEALARRLGADPAQLEQVVQALLGSDQALNVAADARFLIAPEVTGSMSERMLEAVRRFQKANPLRQGMPKGELKEKITGRAPPPVFEWVLARRVSAGELRTERDLVATADHRISLSGDEQQARDFLLERYRQAGYQPPAIAELAAAAKRDPRLLERIARLLIEEGALVKVADGMIFHREVLDELKRAIARRKRETDRIDVAFFKQLAGVTRKHAIPLLEWLDREKITRRAGNERVIL